MCNLVVEIRRENIVKGNGAPKVNVLVRELLLQEKKIGRSVSRL
jgi:hypothetical protein